MLAAPLSVAGSCCRVVQGMEAGWIRPSAIFTFLISCFSLYLALYLELDLKQEGQTHAPRNKSPRAAPSVALFQGTSNADITISNHSSLPPSIIYVYSNYARDDPVNQYIHYLYVHVRAARVQISSRHLPHTIPPWCHPHTCGEGKAT